MPKVALIDDEYGPIEYYHKALIEQGMVVERIDNVQDALAHIDRGIALDAYVVDIMMPTLGLKDPRMQETANGLATGIMLHRELRKAFPAVPIFILTSISNPDILEGIPTQDNTELLSKIETLPFELAALVKEATQGGK